MAAPDRTGPWARPGQALGRHRAGLRVGAATVRRDVLAVVGLCWPLPLPLSEPSRAIPSGRTVQAAPGGAMRSHAVPGHVPRILGYEAATSECHINVSPLGSMGWGGVGCGWARRGAWTRNTIGLPNSFNWTGPPPKNPIRCLCAPAALAEPCTQRTEWPSKMFKLGLNISQKNLISFTLRTFEKMLFA